MIDPIQLSLFQGDFDKFDRLLGELHTDEQKLYGLFWKAMRARIFGETDKSLDLIKEILFQSHDYSQIISLKAHLLQIDIFIMTYREIQKIPRSLDQIKDSIDKLVETENKKELNAYYSWVKGDYALRILGDYKESLEQYNKSKIIFENLGKKLDYAQTMIGIAYIYRLLKNFALSLDNAEIAEKIYKETNSELYLSFLYNDIGLIYRDAGDQLKSIESLKESIKIGERLHTNNMNVATLNIIELYINRGEFEKALDLGLKRINFLEERKQDYMTEISIEPYNYVGSVYQYMGDYEKALEYHMQALQKWNSIPLTHMISVYLSFGYYRVISTLLLSGEREKAEEYLLNFEKMINNIIYIKNRDRATGYFELSKALILKFSPRMINKVKAQEKLKNMVDKDIYFTPDKLEAMKHLCDLYLYELKSEASEEIVKEARDIIERLKEESKEKNMFLWLVEAYILLSRFALIDNKPSEALNYIEEAEKVSNDQKLTNLMNVIVQEKEKLENQILHWKTIIDSNPDLEERIKMSNLEEYIKNALAITKK